MTQKQMDTLKAFYTAKGMKQFVNGLSYHPVNIEVLDYLSPEQFTNLINNK